MYNKLKELREEREEGFTLIELLVVILIIGILAAIAIPVFLNQRKSANDGATQSDVKNASTAVETWITKQKGQRVTVPSLDTLDVKTSQGVTLAVSGTSDGYCIIGTHENGDVASTKGYVYASEDGGMKTDGKACVDGKLTEGNVTLPTPGETPNAGGSENPDNFLTDGETGTIAASNGGPAINWTADVVGTTYQISFVADSASSADTFSTASTSGVNGIVTTQYVAPDNTTKIERTSLVNGAGQTDWIEAKDLSKPYYGYEQNVGDAEPSNAQPVQIGDKGTYYAYQEGSAIKATINNTSGNYYVYYVSAYECVDGTSGSYPWEVSRDYIAFDGNDSNTRIMTDCGADLKAFTISPSDSSDPTISGDYRISVARS